MGFCKCCFEILPMNYNRRICKSCLELKILRITTDFKCEPPDSCFHCPHADCIAMPSRPTQKEKDYLRVAGLPVKTRKEINT